jgi:hypothetical protein
MRSPPGNRPARFVPRLEGLEDRQLLAAPACTLTVIGAGSVLVRGTNRADNITVNDDGTANVNNVVVVCNRRTMLPGVAVSRLEIRTRGGNDTVHYFLNGALQRNVARAIVVKLGTGNDAFAARLSAGLVAGANLAIGVQGAGSDNLSLRAAGDIPIAAGATLSANLVGGPNGNVIQSTYQGALLGSLAVSLTGGFGPDILSSNVVLNQGSSGSASVQEFGGFGDDTLTLVDRKVSLLDRGTITPSADGGQGNNTGVFTADVTPFRIQQKFHV